MVDQPVTTVDDVSKCAWPAFGFEHRRADRKFGTVCWFDQISGTCTDELPRIGGQSAIMIAFANFNDFLNQWRDSWVKDAAMACAD